MHRVVILPAKMHRFYMPDGQNAGKYAYILYTGLPEIMKKGKKNLHAGLQEYR